MDGPVAVTETASTLMQELQADGFELQAVGDRLQIRPIERVTPELRHSLAKRRAESSTSSRSLRRRAATGSGCVPSHPTTRVAAGDARATPLLSTVERGRVRAPVVPAHGFKHFQNGRVVQRNNQLSTIHRRYPGTWPQTSLGP